MNKTRNLLVGIFLGLLVGAASVAAMANLLLGPAVTSVQTSVQTATLAGSTATITETQTTTWTRETTQVTTTTYYVITTYYSGVEYHTKTVVIGPAQTVTVTVGSSYYPAEVFFSPKGGCKDEVIRWINRANRTVHVLIYSFTLDDVADALIKSHEKGLDVKVVFDKGQISEYSEYIPLNDAGVPVKKDTASGYMHNKVAIIDGYVVLTGSFNWSANAEEKNLENLVIIRDPILAQTYEKEFDHIWEFQSEAG